MKFEKHENMNLYITYIKHEIWQLGQFEMCD
jgi:hypothetical protein